MRPGKHFCGIYLNNSDVLENSLELLAYLAFCKCSFVFVKWLFCVWT